MDSIEAVRNYIKDKSIFNSNLTDINLLSGGLANYVYRLKFEDGSSFVFKYYPPFLAFDKKIKVSQVRYHGEKAALKALENQPWLNIDSNSIIRTPKLIYYDDSSYVIIMQDAGKVETLFNLLKANSSLKNEFMIKISKELKFFLNYLTDKSGINAETYPDLIEVNKNAWEIVEAYYSQLFLSQAKNLNLEKELEFFLENSQELYKRKENKTNFVFGDLWPSSILIDEEKELVWIVDWEVCRFETKTRDLEQLMANLWVMKQNPNLFDSEKINFLMKRLQFDFFGSEDKDWRKESDDFSVTHFILWAVSLLNEKHWEINNNQEVALRALEEIKNL